MPNQINLKQIKHPDYEDYEDEWNFYLDSYIGGKSYTDEHLFKYFKEGDQEYSDRKERAYRENHSRKIINIINSYLFKENPQRDISNRYIHNISKNIDGLGHDINVYMKKISIYSSVLGRVYVFIDRPEGEIKNNRDNLDPKNAPYIYMVFPQNVLDLGFDEKGNLKWIFVREQYRDDNDPYNSKGTQYRYRLWLKDRWELYDQNGKFQDSRENNLNYVPCVIIDNDDGNSQIAGRSDLEDIAYIDRNIFNNWSRLDTIVNDQTFSQLIFPIEGFSADVLQNEKLMQQYLTVGTKRVLLYSAAAGTQPSFISPDASQAQFILDLVTNQTKQLYSLLGLSGEVATESSSASGISKSYDFDNLNKHLNSKAMIMQDAENRIFKIIGDYLNIKDAVSVTYPTEFDTRSLMEEITIAKELALMNVSTTFSKEIFANIVNKLFANSSDEIKNIIKDEINKNIDDKKTIQSEEKGNESQS